MSDIEIQDNIQFSAKAAIVLAEKLDAQLTDIIAERDALQKTLDDTEMRAIKAEVQVTHLESRIAELEADADCIWHKRYKDTEEQRRVSACEADAMEKLLRDFIQAINASSVLGYVNIIGDPQGGAALDGVCKP